MPARTHGMSKTQIYNVWCYIKGRCFNPNTKKYHHYGGKGVKMCEEWDMDFMSFYVWSMKNGYHKGLWIDRIDGNGNYEPSNCRWVTPKVQANNTARNHFVTINGVTKTISEWADLAGLPYKTVRDRVRSGFSGASIINPVKKRGPRLYAINGKTMNVKEWARLIGMPYTTLLGKMKQGYEIKQFIQGGG